MIRRDQFESWSRLVDQDDYAQALMKAPFGYESRLIGTGRRAYYQFAIHQYRTLDMPRNRALVMARHPTAMGSVRAARDTMRKLYFDTPPKD